MHLQKDAKIAETVGGLCPAEPLPPRTAAAGTIPDATSPGVTPVDGYQIIGHLGTGGMGSVWRAWQLSTRREVALKLVNPALVATERGKKRFDREVELTARLSHPYIARLYDSGNHNGVYYYAMELIEGLPLDDYVLENRLPLRSTLQLMHAVCTAVQHAHQRGVIHRDLKPSNIIIDREGQPHVLDFGIAKIFESSEAGAAVSVDGEVLGTPAFMSPEQAEGKGDQADTRTDVYSLGVILYLATTNRMPHDIQGSHLEVMKRVAEQDIVRPRKASAAIDAELEAILFKALAHDVESRYSSVGLLADDMQNYLRGEPLIARRRTALYFLRKKLWKHRYLAAAVIAVASSLIGLSVYGSVQIKRQRDNALYAAEQEKNQNRLAQLRLAETLLFWGDGLAAAGKWEEARDKHWEGRDLRARFGVPTTAFDTALVDDYVHAPLPLTEFNGPDQTAYAAAFAPDGRTGYSAGQGGVTAVWDLPTAQQISTIGKPHGKVIKTVFTHDGKRAVYAIIRRTPDFGAPYAVVESQDIGQPENPPLILPLPDSSNVLRMFVSPDGSLVAYNHDAARSGGDPNEFDLPVTVVSRLDGTAKQTVAIGDPPAKCYAFSRDSRKLFVGHELGGVVTGWDLQTSKLVWKSQALHGKFQNIRAIACTVDGNSVLVGMEKGPLAVLGPDGVRLGDVGGQLSEVTSLAISGDDAIALRGDASGWVKLWNTNDGSLQFSVHGHTPAVKSVVFSADDSRAMSVGDNGSIKVWKVKDDSRVVAHMTSPISTVALSADGTIAVVGQPTGLITLADVATGKVLFQYQLPKNGSQPGSLQSIAFGGDAQEILAGHEGNIDRIDLTGQVQPTHIEVGNPRDTTLLSPDGRLALNLGPWDRVSVCDARTGRQIAFVTKSDLKTRMFNIAALSADGTKLLFPDHAQLHVWDIATLHDMVPPMPLAEVLVACAFSPDGKLAIAGSQNGNVSIFDLEKGGPARTLGAHVDPVKYVSFSPDGSFALSGSPDGILKLWDVATGRELRDLEHGSPAQLCAAFGANSNLIFTHRDATGDSVESMDLSWPTRYRQQAERRQQALNTLKNKPADPEALAALGEWYAFRNEPHWAIGLLERARAAGITHPSLPLARCYWKAEEPAKAAAEFRAVLAATDSPVTKAYLTLCLKAVEREVRQHHAPAPAKEPVVRGENHAR